MSSLGFKSATPQEDLSPLKLQTGPDLYVNIVVKNCGEKNAEFERTSFMVKASYFRRTNLNRMNLHLATA